MDQQHSDAAQVTPPPAPEKHPADWKKQKHTSHTTYTLAMAVAWHDRMTAGVQAYDLDAGATYDGPVVDPHGEETRVMTEAAYDAMVMKAVTLLRGIVEEQRQKGVKPAQVKIMPHFELDHAVIVRSPAAAEGLAFLKKIQTLRESGMDFISGYAGIFVDYLLWPVGAQRQDLMDHLPTAFHAVYPDTLSGLVGSRGADLKKRA